MQSRLFLYLKVLTIILIITSGCDRQTQYSILTTVFTGVPPMEELYGTNLPDKNIDKKKSIEKDHRFLFQHPLWAAKQCTECHAPSADLEMQVSDNGSSTHEVGDLSSSPPPGLILPADKLCISCHRDKTARRAIRERLWLHNPVARGDCLPCHNHHQSYNQAHLQQSLDKICSPCHTPDQLPQDCLGEQEDGQVNIDCIECHNVHMGQNRFLLTRDYKEVKILASQ
jgi:predicted CXXCH cytochrome family protein